MSKIITKFMEPFTHFKKYIVSVTDPNLNSVTFGVLLVVALSQPSNFLNAKEMEFELKYLGIGMVKVL